MSTATETAREVEQGAQRAAARKREDLLDEYVAVLQGAPPPDGTQLTVFLRKAKACLGLSNEDVGADHEIVRRVVDLQELVARDAELLERHKALGAEISRRLAAGESPTDVRELRVERQIVSEERREAMHAVERLRWLAHDHKRLFVPGTTPPTLRCADRR